MKAREKTLRQLQTILKNHYHPPGLALNAVRKFQKLSRKDFKLKLKSGAKDCNFGADLDRQLVNQMCLGLRSDRVVDEVTTKGEYKRDNHNFDAACTLAQ